MKRSDSPQEQSLVGEEIIKALLLLIEEKDADLRGHCARVANLCVNFCTDRSLLDQQEIETLRQAARLHDLGLILVPMAVWQKTEELTDVEADRIRQHPVVAENFVQELSCLRHLASVIRHHHELVDGSGYPDGLSGEAIPKPARILAIANRFETMTSTSLLGESKSRAEALEELKQRAGSHFDASLCDLFVQFIETTPMPFETPDDSGKPDSFRETFKSILQDFRSGKLNPPVMPQVVREIQAVVNRSTSTADDMANAIEKDPIIALRLISVANSPIYRGIQEIRTVRQAIPRLGTRETLNIVQAIANRGLYVTKRVKFKLLMDRLWQHSLAAAYAAKLIAQHLELDEFEKFFMMGLIHDVGKILLVRAFSEAPQIKGIHTDALAVTIQEAHCSVGALLLKRWGFENEFVKAVTMHEAGHFSPVTQKEILVTHLANLLTRKIGFSLFEDNFDFAELESANLLKLDPETLQQIAQETKTIIQEIGQLF
jgi:putative nucleotidyltransferase with HDIG domain